MKIGVIGDPHFGAAYNLGKTDYVTQLNSRLTDFSDTFNGIIDRFIDLGVKLVVITGDVFETKKPSSAQLNAFSECLKRVTDSGLEVIIVVGNHDQQRNINTTTVDIYGVLSLPGVSVYQSLDVHSVDTGNGGILNLILMPYRDRRMVGTETNSEAIEVIRADLDGVTGDLIGDKFLVGHMMLEKTVSDDSADEFSINELILPIDMFDDIDLTVMGHVHKHGVLSKSPSIVYSGSMEKVSFGEKDHNKVTLVVDTDNLSVEIIDTPTRNLVEMTFNYSDTKKFLRGKVNEKFTSDICKFSKGTNIDGAIVKFVAQVHDNDLYHVNQQIIRECLLSKNVHSITSIQVSAVRARQLRNSSITEDISEEKAIVSFIDALSEPDNIKELLYKEAANIIEEVELK